MPEPTTEPIRELLDSLYREESGRILATLIRLLGDFDLAEEAMHEAFAVALIIVKQHGGSIEVDTQPGEFTEFRIVLPRAGASLVESGERM